MIVRRGARLRADLSRTYRGGVVLNARALMFGIGVKRDGTVGAVPREPGWYVCTVRNADNSVSAHVVLHAGEVRPDRVRL